MNSNSATSPAANLNDRPARRVHNIHKQYVISQTRNGKERWFTLDGWTMHKAKAKRFLTLTEAHRASDALGVAMKCHIEGLY